MPALSRGSSLLEVMLALLLFSGGVLGLANLHWLGQRGLQQSWTISLNALAQRQQHERAAAGLPSSLVAGERNP